MTGKELFDHLNQVRMSAGLETWADYDTLPELEQIIMSLASEGLEFKIYDEEVYL